MATLSRIIEHLLSIEKPGGGRLAYAGLSQYRLTAVLPSASINYRATPGPSDYAMIDYELMFSSQMVPDVFQVWIQQWGSKFFDALVTSVALGVRLQGFVLITQAQPTLTGLTNLSNLVQYYENFSTAIFLQTREDYELALKEIDKLGTSTNIENLAQECALALNILTGKASAPMAYR